MPKMSAKNASIFINGHLFSTYTTAYEIDQSTETLEATGFSDGCKNYVPGIQNAKITASMLWDAVAGSVHDSLKTVGQTGIITIVPEAYALGVIALSLPYVQANYKPGASVTDILKIGTLDFDSYGSNYGIETGNVLANATVTDTTTGATVDNTIATTVKYSAIAHVFGKTATDTYAVKIQHSTDGLAWNDLVTIPLTGNGTVITAGRITGTGTVYQYRRAVVTRTGAAADSFGYSVILYAL